MKSLLFFLGIIVGIDAERYKCSSNITVELNVNEIAFFDSDVFEQSEDFRCDIHFILNHTSVKNTTAYTAMRMYDTSLGYNVYPQANLYILKNATAFFPKKFIDPDDYTYYLEGYIVFEDSTNKSCHLESISRESPFQFTDDTQVLYLYNKIDSHHTSNRPCTWKFTAPKGYGFKFVFEIFEADAFTQLRIENTTDLLVNEKSAKLQHPFYNRDDFLQIYLTNSESNLEFRVAVSVIKHNTTKTPGKCKFQVYKSYYLWKISSGNNEECTMELSILPQTNILMASDILDDNDNDIGPVISLGDAADYIGYYSDGNTFEIWGKGNLGYTGSMLLSPKPFDATRNITFKYSSDGNVPGFPFSVRFDIIECKCREVLPCDGQYGIMTTSEVYCNNLRCEMKIGKCNVGEKNLRLKMLQQVKDGPDTSLADYFQIYANDKTIPLILNEHDNNTVKVYTFDSTILRAIYLNPYAFRVPKVSHRVVLSPNNPTYVCDITLHPLILFEISEEMASYNYEFEVLHTFDNHIYLYTDETLTTFIHEICLDNEVADNAFFTCTVSNHKNFAVFGAVDGGQIPFLLVQLLHTKKCVFEKTTVQQNIRQPEYLVHDLMISAISKPDTSCLVRAKLATLFPREDYNPPDYSVITKVWTTSKTEMVKIFVGQKNHSLFEYNSQTQKYWKNVVLVLPYINIEIPPNSSILITVSSLPTFYADDGNEIQTFIEISEFPYYSVAATPCYGVSKICDKQLFQYFEITNYPVKFVVEFFDLPDDVSLILRDNSTGIPMNNLLNQTGDFFIFQNQTVAFGYLDADYDTDDGEWFSGVTLFIETVNHTQEP